MAEVKDFRGVRQNENFPSLGGVAVDLSVTDFTPTVGLCRAVWVGVTGNLACILADGSSVVLTNVPVGRQLFAVKTFLKTNTTATGLVALF